MNNFTGMKKELYFDIIVSLLVLLFLYTGISKLMNIDHTIVTMQRQPLPEWSVLYVSWGVPLLELIIAGLLLLSKTRILGVYISLGLLLLFTAYVVLILSNAFGNVPCSCGGVISQLSWEGHLMFNGFYVLLCFVAIYIESGGNMRLRRNPDNIHPNL